MYDCYYNCVSVLSIVFLACFRPRMQVKDTLERSTTDFITKAVTTEKRYAYATVLGWNPDSTINEIHLDAVRVLLKSLKESTSDFVVLLTQQNPDAKNLLELEGAIVKYVSPVESSLDVAQFEPWFVSIALSKLRAFQLTEYDRVQLLDVDSFVWNGSSMDQLFTSFQQSNLVAEGLGADSPLRAGWLLIRPSETDYQQMESILKRGVFDSSKGWDGPDLPIDYPGWVSKIDDKWGFYGSQLEQGKSHREIINFLKKCCRNMSLTIACLIGHTRIALPLLLRFAEE